MTLTNREHSREPFHIVHTFIVLLALTCAVGCQSHGYRKGDAAAHSLQAAAEEVQAESHAIETALETLNDLVRKPAPDLRPQFNHFSAALDRLERAAEQTERTRARIEARSADYFERWDRESAEIQFGIVREQSERRRAAVTDQFHALNERYVEAQGVVRPLISYLNDIRIALSVDLTPGGIEAVKGIVENANQNAQKVQTALATLTGELTESGTAMSSVRVRHAEPAETPAPLRAATP